ncbi:murein biosynthesis integral membrane protein MurJ [Streptomyces sp. KLOTTS4A1]|uniref:murein biosynthesis integral membrane protein MurJ n=1 Tax=Streptomyces sp. KLOTTS4A1 TaxID=3390996 RepID=UPI0039F4E9C2
MTETVEGREVPPPGAAPRPYTAAPPPDPHPAPPVRGEASQPSGPQSSGPQPPRVQPSRAQPAAGGERLGRFLARAAAFTAALTVAGAVLGLVRDQAVARLFGAGAASDAFLVAWTVPEMASTLLIEDGLALLLVPAFSHALARRAALRPREPDPVRALVAYTLPRLVLLAGCATVLLMLAAPWVVAALAPGLARPDLAVACMRWTALTLLGFALAGYLSAGLRAHRSFTAPATIYVAYNIGIIGMLLALHELWGVRAAAAGVAAGSLLMVLVQLPAALRHRPPRTSRKARAGRASAALLSWAVIAPVVLFTTTRQLQVLVERYLAAGLEAGAISHLNYAQKVAQIPMILSLMVCTVTFPVVAKAMAEGDAERVRQRVQRDLGSAALVVLVGTALVIGYAPQIVEVLFQRGAFDAGDTATTAGVMRVYALGLLGQCLVGNLCRSYFSAHRPTWYPLAAMAAGLTATTVAGAWTVTVWGSYGIAGANALGISITAGLLLCGLGRRVVPVRMRRLLLSLARLTAACAVAAGAGWMLGGRLPDALLSLALGCVLVPLLFAATGVALRAPEPADALSVLLNALRRKGRDAR